MGDHINRRDLIKHGFLTAAALSTSSISVPAAGLSESRPTPSGKSVIIVGAGLAGMSAAYELTKAGHDVTILEARTRAGGRVFTLREPFPDGLYAETGATFIPETHDLTLSYCANFDVPIHPIHPRDVTPLYYVRGKRLRIGENRFIDWPFHVTAEEKRLSQIRMLMNYLDPILEDIGDPTDLDWPPTSLKKYDQITLSEFLRSQGASDDAIHIMRLNYLDHYGDGFDHISTLFLLRERALHSARQYYTIKGGCDVLARAFAAELSEKIHYGAPLVEIEQGPNSVRATFLRAGTRQSISADHLVCAIPFSVLRHIEVIPRFSKEKQEAIERLPYTSVTLIYLQLKKKFWVAQGLEGSVYTDLPVKAIFDSTFNQPGPRGILHAHVTGLEARRVARMNEGDRIRFALDNSERVYPGIREHFEGGVSKCWDEDAWAGGGYCWFEPGQMSDLMPHIAKPEGRVHFAGEHTSPWAGWMQGALESGRRVTREIDKG